MSSVHGDGEACGVEVGGQLRALRRLLYCGEWIESHALHVFMLHAPDFLGYESAIDLARDNPEVVDERPRAEEDRQRADDRRRRPRGAPDQRQGRRLVPGAAQARARDARRRSSSVLARSRSRPCRITAGFDFPDYEQDYELVALDQPGEYPIDRGRIVSNRGLDIAVQDYDEHFVEEHVEWSNALHSQIIARGSYLCGPLARFALAADRLSPLAREAAADVGLDPAERNPFRSIVVRCVELVYAADEALRLIADYEEPDAPAIDVEPRAGVGYGCTEAPRGILYHRYELDDERHDPRRQDRAADLAEPADDRGGPARGGRALARHAGRRARTAAASRRSATTTPASPARPTS